MSDDENNKEDDLFLVVEQTDDETAVRLTVASGTGRKITLEEFYLEVEAYIHSLERAHRERGQDGTQVH